MTDSDLNFLIAVIGCMLAVFWVIGRIWLAIAGRGSSSFGRSVAVRRSVVARPVAGIDRKSTRLNSSHQIISYAVFCLKKKKEMTTTREAQVHDTLGMEETKV